MTELGTGDLMAALAELVDGYGCESVSATVRLADGVRMTVVLDVDGALTIERDDGDDLLRRFKAERMGRGRR